MRGLIAAMVVSALACATFAQADPGKPNPWVAVRWREPDAIKVHLPPIMEKKGIGFTSIGARRVHPAENRVELTFPRSLREKVVARLCEAHPYEEPAFHVLRNEASG